MTKEKIITNVLKEQKIINYQTYFANAMSVAMGIYADQETAALRSENEALKKLLRLSGCPELFIEYPILSSRPTPEDIAWAEETIKKYKLENNL